MSAFLRAHARAIGAAAVTILIGAAGWYRSADLEMGTPERIGPGAVPIVLSGALLVLGLLQLGGVARTALVENEADLPGTASGRSWIAPLLAAVAVLVAAGMIFGPSLPATREWLLGFGPADFFALYLSTLTLCMVAVLLVSTTSPTQVASSVLFGLMLALFGTDLESGVIRFADVEFTFVHGLLVALVARFFGFSVFLIAVGFATSVQLEEHLRKALLISRGDFTVFASRPIAATLLAAALFVLLAGGLLRRGTAR